MERQQMTQQGSHLALAREGGGGATVVKRTTGRTIAEFEGEESLAEAQAYADELNMKEQTE